MKNNRLSFDEKLESTKVNFNRRTLLYLIAPVIIILVGIVLVCSINFNLGIDFTGGSTLTVYTNSAKDEGFSEKGYDLSINKEYNEVKKILKNTLKKFDVSVASYQKIGITINDYAVVPASGEKNAVIVKYQNSKEDVDAENREIRLAVLEALGYDVEFDEVFVISGAVNPSVNAEYFMRMAIALAVCIVLTFVYVWIRFNIQGAFAALLTAMIDVFVAAGLIAIFRIKVGTAFVTALFGVLIFSVISTFVVVSKMKQHLKVGLSLAKVENEEIVNRAVVSNLVRTILMSITFVVAGVVVMAFGGLTVTEFLLTIVFGALSSFYTSTFITPALWAAVYKPSKRKLEKYKEKAEKKDKKEEYQV